jgi:integrase
LYTDLYTIGWDMAKRRLTAKFVTNAKSGTHGDGEGLYLVVSPSGAKKWIFRFTWQRRASVMGLGSASVISLAEARNRAFAARQMVASGSNPVNEKRRAAMQDAARKTFGEVADELIASKEAGWRNQKHRNQWASSLATYAATLGPLPVDEVDTEAVLAVLKPIWTTKPETANRVRNRIEAVLNAAKAKGLRSGENPAVWKGHLDHLLAKRPKSSARGHFKALPYREAPDFFKRLRAIDTVAARALEFCILTAARSNEVFGLKWAEIDIEGAVWNLPPGRTKAEREHRVPLSGAALLLLKKMRLAGDGQYVFPSPRGDRPLSHIAMQKVLTRMGVVNATVHGFRSTFRDWAGDATPFPREVAEAALSHKVGDAAEQAYRRGDALEKRRSLMEAWASFCNRMSASSNVIAISGAGSRI